VNNFGCRSETRKAVGTVPEEQEVQIFAEPLSFFVVRGTPEDLAYRAKEILKRVVTKAGHVNTSSVLSFCSPLRHASPFRVDLLSD